MRKPYEEEWMDSGPHNEEPVPMKLYAVGNGKREFVGEAYTLDAASEAIGEDDWPKGCLGVLVDADGTEMVFLDGEWNIFQE